MSRTVVPQGLPDLPPGMPAQGEWTYEDYCRIPDDGKRYEVIRGVLYLSPAPRMPHQECSGNFYFRLRSFVEPRGLGKVHYAPVDVILPGLATPVQPDILFVAEARKQIVELKYVHGAPDLLVEVLSPSNPSHDRKTKFALYAEAGVAEYWILDSRARTISVFALEGKAYKLHCRSGRGETATSRLIEGFEVAVDDICDGR